MPRHSRFHKQRASQPGLTRQPLNAQRNYERYLEMARVKAASGDLIAAENCLQHAEHYLRSMNAQRAAGSSDRGH